MKQFSQPQGFLGSVAGWLMLVRNKERNRWTLQLLKLRPTEAVLEIGFGPGWAVEQAAQAVTKGRVAGVDPSATMLADASRRNAKAIQTGRVKLQLGAETPLPFEDGSFDKVFAVNSFQFWSDSAKGLSEAKRVLKPGGRVAITVQPMWVKTDDEAQAVGAKLKSQLSEAGFRAVVLEVLPLKPLCLCATGVK